jgi:hypothetical protein
LSERAAAAQVARPDPAFPWRRLRKLQDLTPLSL